MTNVVFFCDLNAATLQLTHPQFLYRNHFWDSLDIFSHPEYTFVPFVESRRKQGKHRSLYGFRQIIMRYKIVRPNGQQGATYQ